MKRWTPARCPTALVLGLLVLLTAPALARQLDHEPGELLLILDDTSVLSLQATGEVVATAPDLAELLLDHGLGRYEMLVRKTGSLTANENRYVKLLSKKKNFDPVQAATELTATGLFRAVSPNYQFELFVLPNDSYLSYQWHINTGNDADIDLPEAWDVEQGDASTVIAIIDTGVDWSHPDIAGNAWHNPGEIAGNGQDDDGNGYIDDVYGWDCGESDNNPWPDPYFELGIDVGFHGTHCAGIASAATNNGQGIAGAGWSCKVMGLKVTSSGSSFSTAAVTTAFLYAITEQVDVISMSFGGTYQDFGFMQSLVDDATAAGIVCVAAAGNDNSSVVTYPAGLNNVLSVGATNESNQRASFSTYGNWVDCCAPGQQIWSTIQTNYDWDFLTGLLFMLSYGWDGTNPYMYSDGTSMACPLVAGVCALVRSAAPSLPAEMVAQRILDTGDHLSYDQPIGVKVNAFAAVDGLALSAVGDATPGLPGALLANPNPFNPQTELSFSLAATGPVRLEIFDPAGRLVIRLLDVNRSDGEQRVRWDGRNRSGQRVSSGLYFARLTVDSTVRSIKLVMLK